ncbi:MAG: purine-nucleoside phosphorylase [Alphaproteobacteria bacterium]|nr:purine-nucleoside phosphorylase [Alphaproteobacteria bacterium]
MSDVKKAAEVIRKKLPGFKPRLAFVLGSGLGAVADLLEEQAEISYGELPGFPVPTVQGHEGNMRLGTVDGVPVVFLKGRVHLYEGVGVMSMRVMIRTLKEIGTDMLFLTNAAGSLMPSHGPGSVVAITDHINFTGINPLSGPNDEEWGPRFPPMDEAWDKDGIALLQQAAQKKGVDLGQGVYAQFLGPNFETPAEVRMAGIVGAHLVGMSTAAENIIASHCGLKCVGVSAVTNMGAGLSDEALSHEQTLQGAALAADKMAVLVREFINLYGAERQAA